MTDELSQTDATIDSETEEAIPDTQQAQKGKVFTQEELNKIVAKEKQAWKKSADRDKQLWEAAESNLRGDVTFYEEKLKSIITTQTADFDPITLDLFTALPVREQLEKLSNEEFMAKIKRRNTIPETPKSNSDNKPTFTRRQTV
jgi:hypothetical protein